MSAPSTLPLLPLALYVHIPWCVQKCPYCDFNSHAQKQAIPEVEYVAALLDDLSADLAYVAGRTLSSIFIGGGTPSLFSAQAIERLLSGIRARIPFADDIEITLEANPGTVEADRFADLLITLGRARDVEAHDVFEQQSVAFTVRQIEKTTE